MGNTMHAGGPDTRPAQEPNLVRWGAVFAGAVTSIALFMLFSAFWMALAYSGLGTGLADDGINMAGVADNLGWYLAASGVVAVLFGGFVAGWVSGLRGGGKGALEGFLTWGVTLFGVVVLGAPSFIGAIGVRGTGDGFAFGGFWESFIGMGIALVAAVVGGILGGASGRPKVMYEPQAYDRDDAALAGRPAAAPPRVAGRARYDTGAPAGVAPPPEAGSGTSRPGLN